MATHLILVDLRAGSGSHDRIRRYLGSFDRSFEIAGVHLVETDRDARQVRDAGRSHLGPTESIVVLEVTGQPWATGGSTPVVNAWLRQHVSGRRETTS